MRILFSKIHPNAVIPEYKTPGAVAFDFAVPETVVLKEGINYVKTGLRVKIPDGFGLFLAPRSGTYKNFGLRLANSVGVIDRDYCGPNDELMFAYVADREITVNAGERIGQGFLLATPTFEIVESDWTADDRGGFGSTGK